MSDTMEQLKRRMEALVKKRSDIERGLRIDQTELEEMKAKCKLVEEAGGNAYDLARRTKLKEGKIEKSKKTLEDVIKDVGEVSYLIQALVNFRMNTNANNRGNRENKVKEEPKKEWDIQVEKENELHRKSMKDFNDTVMKNVHYRLEFK